MAITGHEYFEAQWLEHASQHLAVFDVVVDHQHAAARAVVADDVVFDMDHRLRHAHFGEEQAQLKNAAATLLALH